MLIEAGGGENSKTESSAHSAMDHDAAVRTQACKRYLLGELPKRQRAEFEAHFVECPDCAEGVRVGLTFVANLVAPSHPRPSWQKWISRLCWWRGGQG